MPYPFAFFTRQKYQEVRNQVFLASDSTRVLDKLFAREELLSVETERAAFQFWVCFHVFYNQYSKRFDGMANLLACYLASSQPSDIEQLSPEMLFLSDEDKLLLIQGLRYDWKNVCDQAVFANKKHPAATLLSQLLDILSSYIETKPVTTQYLLTGIQSCIVLLALDARTDLEHQRYTRMKGWVHQLLSQDSAPSMRRFARNFHEEIQTACPKMVKKEFLGQASIVQFVLDCLAEIARILFQGQDSAKTTLNATF